MLQMMQSLGEGFLAMFGVLILIGLIGILISLCQKYEIDGFPVLTLVLFCLFVIGVVLIVLAKCMAGTA